MNREELAWAAGIVDGEGSFDGHKTINQIRKGPKTRYSMRLTIGQSTHNPAIVPQMLNRFLSLFPGMRLSKVKMLKPPSNPQYHIIAYGIEQVQHVAASIWPWLGDVKRDQYKSVLSEWI